MTSEIGTLKELNVQVGDVVRNLGPHGLAIKNGMVWTISRIHKGTYYAAHNAYPNGLSLAHDYQWEIVSRAIIDWSKVDRGTLVSTLRSNGSWRDGTTFLCYHKEVDDNREWIVASYKGDIPQSFLPNMVKLCPPPPVVTEHVGVVYAGNEQRTTTYQTVDGKMDWSTFKVNDK